MTALARTNIASSPSSERLRAVTSTRPGVDKTAVPKLRYIVVTLAGIFAILGAQLMLSIAVSGGAYEIAELKGEMRNSSQQLQVVAEDINALTSPDTLATLATSMGMVADNNPAYLRLSDAAVLGEAVPAREDLGAQLFSVTAGTETVAPPAILNTVFENLSGATSAEIADDASGVTAETPTMAVANTTVAAVAIDPPPTRFGGSIPSPTTR
jgi:hypothetical protein